MSRQLPNNFDLVLYDTVKRGSAALANVRRQLGETWKRSIRSTGGFWSGTAEVRATLEEMQELFLYGLGREIVESIGGLITWQGFIVQMDLTLGGLTYTRKWTDLANRVQAIYTKLGDNLLTNGSVETGAWGPSFNGPDATSGQSTAWVTDGVYSEYIFNSPSPNGGKYIQQGIAISAGQAYDCQVSINVTLLGGSAPYWWLVIQKHGAGQDGSGYPLGILGSASTNTLGQGTLTASIPATNTYSGQVDILVYNKDGNNSKAYFDAATFRASPAQARTAWYANTLSQTDWGTLELALIEAGLSDAAANAKAQTALALSAWPRTQPPDRFAAGRLIGAPDGLVLTFAGYVWTMRNRYAHTAVGQTQNASVHVANQVADCEFVSAGKIDSNLFQYQLDGRAPYRMWEVLAAIIQAGDAAGNRWQGGVYGGRKFNYSKASTTIDYHYRDGQLLTLSSDPVDPWLARPGLVYLDDLPGGTASLSANAADDPHVAFVEEVEFDAAAWLAGNSGLNFIRQAGLSAI